MTPIVSKVLNKSGKEYKTFNGCDELQRFSAEDISITIKNSPG